MQATQDVYTPPVTPVNSVTDLAGYKSLVEELGQHVSLVTVHIRRWRGCFNLREATIQVQNVFMNAGDGVSSPSLYVMPDLWRKRFNKIEQRLRGVADRYTIPIQNYTPIRLSDGTTEVLVDRVSLDKVVPRKKEEIVRSTFYELVNEQWLPAIHAFLQEYPQILEDFKLHQADRYALVKEKLPAQAQDIRRLFCASLSIRPFGLNLDDLTLESLERGAGEYLDNIRTSLLQETAGRLIQAAERLRERIGSKEVIQKSHLVAVTEALANFRNFSAALGQTPAALDQVLREAEKAMMTTEVKDVNASAKHAVGNAAAVVGNLLGALVQKVDDAFSGEGAGNRRRLLLS